MVEFNVIEYRLWEQTVEGIKHAPIINVIVCKRDNLYHCVVGDTVTGQNTIITKDSFWRRKKDKIKAPRRCEIKIYREQVIFQRSYFHKYTTL